MVAILLLLSSRPDKGLNLAILGFETLRLRTLIDPKIEIPGNLEAKALQ